MASPNLPVVVFFIVLLTQIVTWVGKTVLQEVAFAGYMRLFLAKSQRVQRRLRKQVLEDKAELAKTSSQDEFAKWAKLKRKVDKGLADLEATSESLPSGMSSYGRRSKHPTAALAVCGASTRLLFLDLDGARWSREGLCCFIVRRNANRRQPALLGALGLCTALLDAHLGYNDWRVVIPRLVVPQGTCLLAASRLGARSSCVAPPLPRCPEG